MKWMKSIHRSLHWIRERTKIAFWHARAHYIRILIRKSGHEGESRNRVGRRRKNVCMRWFDADERNKSITTTAFICLRFNDIQTRNLEYFMNVIQIQPNPMAGCADDKLLYVSSHKYGVSNTENWMTSCVYECEVRARNEAKSFIKKTSHRQKKRSHVKQRRTRNIESRNRNKTHSIISSILLVRVVVFILFSVEWIQSDKKYYIESSAVCTHSPTHVYINGKRVRPGRAGGGRDLTSAVRTFVDQPAAVC